MRYDARELLALAGTSVGRVRLGQRARLRLAPAFQLAAAAHRRTLARHVRLTAVTGSFGKTTTAGAIAAALGVSVTEEVTERLVRNGLAGVPLAMLGVRRGQAHAVLEVGIDHAGQMSRHSRTLQPDVAVITAVGSEHQIGLGSLATTQREKACLLEGLRRPGLAVLNGDDPRVRAMAAWTDARVVTYGFGPDNDVRASDMRLDWPRGTRFTLHADGATREIRLQLLGRTMVAAALAAVAVATNQGRALDDVIVALEGLAPTAGRLQVVALPDQVTLVRDDTKCSVETIHAAVDVLADIPGRRILVLSESPTWPESLEASYRRLGERIADVFDAAVFIGDTHDRLAAHAREAGMPAPALHTVEPGVLAAIAALRMLIRPGDTVLVKGRLRQKLERIPLALQGETVSCDLLECRVATVRCATCRMRAAGWGERRILT
jgi:UDP-N-acetylmuramoyl-tripeptide--D-alanyl-D-alanine ligase